MFLFSWYSTPPCTKRDLWVYNFGFGVHCVYPPLCQRQFTGHRFFSKLAEGFLSPFLLLAKLCCDSPFLFAQPWLCFTWCVNFWGAFFSEDNFVPGLSFIRVSVPFSSCRTGKPSLFFFIRQDGWGGAPFFLFLISLFRKESSSRS